MKQLLEALASHAQGIAEAIGTLLLILLLAMLAATFLFFDFFLELLGLLLFGIQAGLFIIVAAGCVWLAWFSGDRLLMLLMRVEEYRQERARSAQEWAQVAVIESQAAVNWAQAEAAGTIVEQITPRRAALVVRGDDMRLVPALDDGATDTPALPAGPPLQLRQVFKNLVQVYAIVGGQQTGKTFQARHVASDWQRRGMAVWVVGPKWDRGEWYGCRMFGGAANYDAVSAGLAAVQSEAERRHGDTHRGHKEHAPLVVVLDDWTPIVEKCDNAQPFIYDATTLFASVNIILMFLIHADTADAWGVGRKGAALTHNFVKAYIIPAYDDNGTVVRSETRAEVLFPGQTERRPLLLESQPVEWPTVPGVPGNEEGVPRPVPRPVPPVPVPPAERLAERYEGRDLEIAEAIQRGWSKTKTRESVTGRAADIGQRYDEIKAELDAATESEIPPAPAKTIQLKKQPPPIALWAPGAGEVLQ